MYWNSSCSHTFPYIDISHIIQSLHIVAGSKNWRCRKKKLGKAALIYSNKKTGKRIFGMNALRPFNSVYACVCALYIECVSHTHIHKNNIRGTSMHVCALVMCNLCIRNKTGLNALARLDIEHIYRLSGWMALGKNARPLSLSYQWTVVEEGGGGWFRGGKSSAAAQMGSTLYCSVQPRSTQAKCECIAIMVIFWWLYTPRWLVQCPCIESRVTVWIKNQLAVHRRPLDAHHHHPQTTHSLLHTIEPPKRCA